MSKIPQLQTDSSARVMIATSNLGMRLLIRTIHNVRYVDRIGSP
jgi:hypothetical protein